MKKSFTAKLWKVMKLCALQWMIALAFAGVSAAHSVEGQVLDREISITLTGVPFEDALGRIQELTHVKFFYSPGQLATESPVSMEVDGGTLGEVLDELLTPRRIEYRVHEREATITLRKVVVNERRSLEGEATDESKKRLLAEVTGTVTDSNGQPMAGVNVVVKGTTIGTTTDSDGRYRIEASGDATLVFTFIGFSSIEAKVGGQTVIDVVLQENVTSLGEVVVNAGYYSTTKKLQTGSIVKIDAEQISQQPVSDPLAALQGRVAGMEIVQTSGVPGSNFTVRIRGTNSIASGNDPLYIIDGVPYTSTPMSFGETSGSILSYGTNPLMFINPADIESVEILKDADATAIYGSRGANGVVLITTKKGQSGKTKVNLNFYSGTMQVAHRMDLLNTQQYLEMRKEAFANDGIAPTTAQDPDLLLWDTTRYTDWQKKLIGGTGRVTDLLASITDGGDWTKFRISGGYRNETTVFPGENGQKRVSFQVSLDNTSVNQKLKSSFSANYSSTFSDMPSLDLTLKALTLAPNAPPLYDEEGKLNWNGWMSNYENPVAFLERPFEAVTQNLISNAVISYSILPNLDVLTRLGYTNTAYSAVTVSPIRSLSPDATQINRSIFSNSQFNNWVAEPQLAWKSHLGNGTLDILIGTTFLDQTTEGLAQYASGFTSEALMKNIAAASLITSSTNYYSKYRYHAVFGRVNYNYKSRYIVNLTGRRDGSSRFGPGRQFAFFKAIGFAWLFSNESFVEDAFSFLSFGKLRASYGTTGNDQIGDYQFLDTYSVTSAYQGIIGLAPTRLNNPDFAWEENRKMEFGAELGFLNDRIRLNFTYYRNRSGSQLIGQPLAPTTGFSVIQANFPAAVENRGVEVELSVQNLQTHDFRWVTSLNLTVPSNELVSFPDIESFPVYDQRYALGKPLTISKRFHYVGIDPATGYYSVEDFNGDGNYTMDDRKVVGFIGRNYYGGVQSTLTFKSLQLDVLLQYVSQEGYGYTRIFTSTPGSMSNQPVVVLQRANGAGGNAPIQRFSTTSEAAFSYLELYSVSDAAIEDASFFRVKGISLACTLPKPWLHRFGIADVRAFVQGRNLVTITNHSGMDPENPGSTTLPSLRTVIAGIQLSF